MLSLLEMKMDVCMSSCEYLGPLGDDVDDNPLMADVKRRRRAAGLDDDDDDLELSHGADDHPLLADARRRARDAAAADERNAQMRGGVL